MAGTTTYYGISYPTNTDYVKDGATAMQTIADGFDSAVAIPTYNNQTGTTYTFVLADAGKTVTSNNASAVTFTIPPQTSVAWANNTTLTVRNLGAGVVTIAGGAGVTVTNTAQTVAQYGSVRIIRTASNAWTVVPASGSSVDTVLAEGTFTNQSAINFTNVLSDTYKFYRLNFYCWADNTGSAQNVNMRFRENTTDVTTAYYAGGVYGADSNTTGSFNAKSNATFFQITTAQSNASNYISSVDMVINRPSATQGTYQLTTWDIYNGVGGFNAGIRTGMTNFTGFSIYPAGSNISGYYLLTGRKA